MPSLKIKRGTRAQLDAAAAANQLNQGEPYLITDEGLMAVGLSANTYEVFGRQSELALQVNRPTLIVDGSDGISQSLSAATWTKIAGGLSATPIEDTLSGWDGTNKRYVVQKSGLYLAACSVGFTVGGTGITFANVRVNGTSVLSGARFYNSSGDKEGLAVGSIRLSVNDVVELYGYTQVAGTANQSPVTKMSLAYLGG